MFKLDVFKNFVEMFKKWGNSYDDIPFRIAEKIEGESYLVDSPYGDLLVVREAPDLLTVGITKTGYLYWKFPDEKEWRELPEMEEVQEEMDEYEHDIGLDFWSSIGMEIETKTELMSAIMMSLGYVPTHDGSVLAEFKTDIGRNDKWLGYLSKLEKIDGFRYGIQSTHMHFSWVWMYYIEFMTRYNFSNVFTTGFYTLDEWVITRHIFGREFHSEYATKKVRKREHDRYAAFTTPIQKIDSRDMECYGANESTNPFTWELRVPRITNINLFIRTIIFVNYMGWLALKNTNPNGNFLSYLAGKKNRAELLKIDEAMAKALREEIYKMPQESITFIVENEEGDELNLLINKEKALNSVMRARDYLPEEVI